jgi:hypothetical protein
MTLGIPEAGLYSTAAASAFPSPSQARLHSEPRSRVKAKRFFGAALLSRGARDGQETIVVAALNFVPASARIIRVKFDATRSARRLFTRLAR